MKTDIYSNILALKDDIYVIVSRNKKLVVEKEKINEIYNKQDKTINELLDAKELICENLQYNKMNDNENESLEKKYQELKGIIEYCYKELDESKELLKQMHKRQEFNQLNIDNLLKIHKKY
ncbi:MAG: hypothetical protein ACRCSV_02360 [Chlamydiales bacterium]